MTYISYLILRLLWGFQM
ncbi:hypothetical protein F383_30204 [Gossypium arboreum]|uniref:Uncharacterized protein n=1 Tax=Gossypium arboreum TaxID=29729 RepID=A0A0B0PEG5_GOSAR|nr:hypothetical protein F383_30204 [Gossypium arboreum]